MGTKTEAEMLRAEIAALSELKQARRYPPELKRRVVRWAVSEVARGASLAGLCEQLDMSEPTLQRFLGETKAAKSDELVPAFARVTVTETMPAAPRLVMRGPHGLEVDGLSVETLAQLLKRLSCSG